MISDFIGMQGMDAGHASQAGIDYLGHRINGQRGVVVIDKVGNCAARFNTRKMIHGWI